MNITDLPERMRRKIDASSSECWLWIASLDRDGYGRSGSSARRLKAHRHVYELLVGSIPVGLQLDHLCRVRRCVNPDHLEPVAQRQNVLRGVGITASNARKRQCPRGHSYEGDNLYIAPDGRRCCVACRLVACARYRSNQRKELIK